MRVIARLVLALLVPIAASAQSVQSVRSARSDSAFADLRRDGNDIVALRSPVKVAFNGTAERALREIADVAKLNLTFDPRLAGMTTTLAIPAHDRTASVALLEIARASRLRVIVLRTNQLVVVSGVTAPPDPSARPAAAASRDPVTLPTVETRAPRVERRDFELHATVGEVSITGHELTSSPQFIEPDVLRSVQLFPGIVARSDYAAGFNVRGGEADQNLILIDGYPIYNPFHLGGLFSTFIDPSVGRVELRTGGLPVQFGGRLSGVLDVRSAEETRDGLHGTAEVSLVSSLASVGHAFADGQGSWMIAARRTYADFVVNLIKPGGFPYHFQDIQGHVTRQLPGGFRIAATAYDGLDAADPQQTKDPTASWGNGVIGATLAKRFDARPSLFGHVIGDSATVEQRASLSRFGMHIDAASDFVHAANTVLDQRVGGAITLFGSRFTHTLGYEIAGQRLAYSANSSIGAFGDLFPFDSLRQRSSSRSVYADELWRPSPAWLIEGGLRSDDVAGVKGVGVAPRLSVKYFVNRDLAITAAAGSYRQWIHSLGREEEPVEPLQFWIASDSSAPVSRARDAILGVERWVTPSRLLHVEGFYKRYDDLLIPNAISDPRVHGDEFAVIGGESYGADVLLRQLDTGPFSGWIAYSYALSSRVSADGHHYFPTQDRRHSLNLVGSWHTGRYTLGARLNVASGMPYTPVLGSFLRNRYDPVTKRWVPDNGQLPEQAISADFNSARLPWYQRTDISLSRATQLFGTAFTPYLSVVNVFNSHNPAAYLYSFTGQPNRGSIPNLPFAPTFGFSFVY